MQHRIFPLAFGGEREPWTEVCQRFGNHHSANRGIGYSAISIQIVVNFSMFHTNESSINFNVEFSILCVDVCLQSSRTRVSRHLFQQNRTKI